ncbi:hypothetical protein LDENG_00259070 [Lucifuga dentata]|nr:hypothetical protein LDENG_00259070 [Lucifuga dentata]
MTEQRLLFIDIEPKPSSSTAVEGTAKKPLWTHSNNSFKFNFFTNDSPRPQEESASSDRNQPAGGLAAFTEQGSAFAFNFQIPPVPPEEDMKMMETSETIEEKLLVSSPSKPSEASSKAKKKKKSGKKKASERKEADLLPISTEECTGGEDTELSAEQQLNRQLDWCIEQLELAMRSQKSTPKQKEEASRALKTLHSSKAPLAKKRQVMRAMTGDYRKKMEEEKSKQFQLIKSEITAAQVKAVSDSPKKSVFHRRAEVKSQTPATEEEDVQKTEARAAEMMETSAFVFAPSKEEFRFNFL